MLFILKICIWLYCRLVVACKMSNLMKIKIFITFGDFFGNVTFFLDIIARFWFIQVSITVTKFCTLRH